MTRSAHSRTGAEVILLASLATACGGSGSDNLFGGSPGGARSTGSGGSGGQFAMTSGGTANGAGGVESGGVGAFGGSGAFGGDPTVTNGGANNLGGDPNAGGFFGNGGSPDADAGTGGMSAGGTPTFVSVPPAAGATVDCNGKACPTDKGGECCIDVSSTTSGNTPQTACLAAGAACGFPYAATSCDGPEDCGPGTVCCGSTTSVFGILLFTELKCVSANACFGIGGLALMCHPGPSVCPGGTSCVAALTLPAGYDTCQ